MAWWTREAPAPADYGPGGTGIPTGGAAFAAQVQATRMSEGYLNFEDRRVVGDVERELTDQVLPSIPLADLNAYIEQTQGFDFIRRPPESVEAFITEYGTGPVLELARQRAAEDPTAFGVDVSPEAVEAQAVDRLNTRFQALTADAELAPQGAMRDLAASFIAGTVNYKALPFLLAGGGSGSLARVAVREGVINMGVEGALFTGQQRAAEDLGLDAPVLTTELRDAFVFGAAFGGAFEGLTRAVNYAATRGRPIPGADPITSQAIVEAAAETMARSPDPVPEVQALVDRIMPAPPPPPQPNERPADLPPLILQPADRVAQPPLALGPADRVGQPPLMLSPEARVQEPAPRAAAAAIETPEAPRVSAEVLAERDARIAQLERDFKRQFGTSQFRVSRMIAGMGGIQSRRMEQGFNVTTWAGGELASRGITPKRLPFLFNNRTGRGTLDNLDIDPFMLNLTGRSEDGLYARPEGIIDLIQREAAGEFIPTSREMADAWDELQAARRGRDDPEPDAVADFTAKDSEQELGLFIDLDPFDGSWVFPENIKAQFDAYLDNAQWDLRPYEYDEVLRELQTRGGEAEYLIEQTLTRDVDYWEARGVRPEEGQIGAPAGQGAETDFIPGFGDPPGGGAPDAPGGIAAGTAPARQAAQGTFKGIAPVTQRERAEAQMAAPLGGAPRGPDSQIGGLFDPGDKVRADLFDSPLAPQAEALQDAQINDLRSALERDGDIPIGEGPDGPTGSALADLAELDRDAADLARINLCGMM